MRSSIKISRREKAVELKGILELVNKGGVLKLPTLPLKELVEEANIFFPVAESILSNPESNLGSVLETVLQMQIYITNMHEQGVEGRGYSMAFFGVYEGVLNQSPHFGE